jgi:hypothetical protein
MEVADHAMDRMWQGRGKSDRERQDVDGKSNKIRTQSVLITQRKQAEKNSGGKTAVQNQRLAGHIGTVIADQPGYRASHFFRLTKTFERNRFTDP